MLDIKKILNELPDTYISEKDYENLMNALKVNRLKTQAEAQKKKKDAWMKIIEAIQEYERKYGLIKIETDNCGNEWTFNLDNVGKIEIIECNN